MKAIYLFSLFILFILWSCIKNLAEEDNSEIIEVVELASNKPITGAAVTLYRCTRYDNIFGCLKVGVSSVYSTNSSGVVKISSIDYSRSDEGIKISKNGYWTQDGHSGKNELCPEGWINLNIKRTSSYPDSLFFILFNVEERFRLTTSNGIQVLKMKQRADTTLTIRAFGSEKNTLLWKVGEELFLPYGGGGYIEVASGSLTPVDVPANGTINLSLNY